MFLFDLSRSLPLTPAFPNSPLTSHFPISCIARNYKFVDMASVPIAQSQEDMAQALATSSAAGAGSISPSLPPHSIHNHRGTVLSICPFIPPVLCVFPLSFGVFGSFASPPVTGPARWGYRFPYSERERESRWLALLSNRLILHNA